jgi:hypothetical protein
VRSRVSVLTETLLRQRTDIEEFFVAGNDPESFLDYYGGPDYFDDACIYDSVDDATACWLLNDWLDGQVQIGWDCHLELSKLLAKRGHLVQDKVEKLVRQIASGEVSFSSDLCLSFLPSMKDGEQLAIGLLEIAPDDRRDGLFHARYKLNTPLIYEAFKSRVRRWVAADDSWGNGTGEAWLVNRMVDKWDQTFPKGDHAGIRQLCQRVLGS